MFLFVQGIKFMDDYSGFFIFFITFCTFGALIWYAWETRKMARGTSESVKLTKDKEQTDRALDMIENFNEKRFEDLINDKNKYTSKLSILTKDFTHINEQYSKDFPGKLKDVKYFINYFDTAALLKYENKLNEKIFFEKFDDILLIFISAFEVQIKESGTYPKDLIPKTKHRYFFKLCIEVLEKNIEKNPKEQYLSERVLPILLQRYREHIDEK